MLFIYLLFIIEKLTKRVYFVSTTIEAEKYTFQAIINLSVEQKI